MWSRADDWVSNQVFWRGWQGYEPETVPLFYRLACDSAVILDIGAYVGFFSLLAGHANPRSRVFAFEPLPLAYERLLQNVARNALSNVTSVATAIGREEGEVEFFHQSPAAAAVTASDGEAAIPCSSSLSEAFFMPGAQGLVSTKVRVTTMDGFLGGQNIETVDLVKIDTETTEPDVLEGMTATLRRSRPAIFCEVLGNALIERLEGIVHSHGYSAYLLTDKGPVRKERIAGHPVFLNYFFTTMDDTAVKQLATEAAQLAARSS